MKKIFSAFIILAMLISGVAYAGVLSEWADDLYEPETSIVAPPSVIWMSNGDSIDTAGRRPNTIIIRTNSDLNALDMDGNVISDDLSAYLKEIKSSVLPAIFVDSEKSANALNKFCKKVSLSDAFAMADSAHASYVGEICDENEGMLGIIDFSNDDLSTRDALYEATALTNRSHAKIMLISSEDATAESVRYLRRMLMTVWVKADADTKDILTAITSGAHGIVCENYDMVISAMELFDDGRALTRLPLIGGHCGLPCQYIENTIRSALGAEIAGADVSECDIQLSKDNQIFLLHDDSLKRLFNNSSTAAKLTLEKLQSFKPDTSSSSNSVYRTNNENPHKKGRSDIKLDVDTEIDRIPSLRDYLAALQNGDMIIYVEIKTKNTKIVKIFRDLCDEMGVMDRVVIVSFKDGLSGKKHNSYKKSTDVLLEVRKVWPEVSIGYLAFTGTRCEYLGKTVKANNGKTGKAVGYLYDVLQPYNAVYSVDYNKMSIDVVLAARHRGLTSWPWTYKTESDFAKAYISGVDCLHSNFATWGSYLPIKVEAADCALNANGDTISGTVTLQNGDTLARSDLSVKYISGVNFTQNDDGTLVADGTGETLAMLRLENTVTAGDVDLSEYDLDYSIYSAPFIINWQ